MTRDERFSDDDGRTIADMSGVGDAISRPSLVSSLTQGLTRDGHPDAGPVTSSRDFAEELQGPEERLMVILGTLRAALSVGMVYIVIFGLAIALMVALWT